MSVWGNCAIVPHIPHYSVSRPFCIIRGFRLTNFDVPQQARMLPYVNAIFANTKGRPDYIVQSHCGGRTEFFVNSGSSRSTACRHSSI